MEIVGVGIATIDVIQEVDAYPDEDSKIRALTSRKTRGGNVTNALAISAQLGCICRWLGTMTDPTRDGDAAFVTENLRSFGVDASAADVLSSGSMPISYILASKATGSRTIIHHRDLPELSFDSFCKGVAKIEETRLFPTGGHNMPTTRWFHFEGRNLENVRRMIEFLRSRGNAVMISLEIEALRNDWDHIERLLKHLDIAFVSKDYIRKKLRLADARAFFDHFRQLWRAEWNLRAVICPWGADGVYYLDTATQTEHHVTTASIDSTVDSVGAGDSFIGGALAAFAHGVSLPETVDLACRVATTKCRQHGFRLPVSFLDDVIAQMNRS